MATDQTGTNPRAFDYDIRTYLRRGYRVLYRDESTVQLVRPKQFNTWAALAGAMFFGFSALLYVIYFLGQKEDIILLTLDDSGSVDIQNDAPTTQDTMLGLAIIGAGVLLVIFVIAFFAAV